MAISAAGRTDETIGRLVAPTYAEKRVSRVLAFRAAQFSLKARVGRFMKTLPIVTSLVALGLVLSPGLPAIAHDHVPAASVAPLIQKAKLPYERFTLPNGLRVLVHTDRKAPVVAVSVWYDIGSKQEPKGKTGFAHLFEHLMFNGSENADDDWFQQTTQMGATVTNGSTWYDRTNYFETVPVGALERILYLESDRMGHLLGAVTPEKLANQIGVVQNEKRQGDNKPFGLVGYAQTEALYPASHPYGHDTIGSMADLSAASLNDVKQWFRDHYGPNNAVLVLSGDIDARTARPLVERYFGDIPKGPQAKPVAAPVPTLKARTEIVLKDRVPTTRLYRTWVVPGLNDPDAVALDMGASVLGGLASSRLDNALVRDEQLAVRVTAGLQSFAQMGQFEVTADVKPGIDPAIVGKRLDELIAELIANGPTPAELNRVVTRQALSAVNALQTVNGKATLLAEGELYSHDPNHFAADLAKASTMTPAKVQAAMAKWLKRPVLALTVVPGARDAYAEAPAAPVVKAAAAAAAPDGPRVKRGAMPEIGQLSDLAFPAVERTSLSNGIEVTYARRGNVPLTQIALSFDAGFAADPKARLGVALITTALLKEGTATLSSKQIAEREEELGASIGAGSNMDRTTVSLATLSSSLAPSLDLLTDVLQRPAFAPRELERVRTQLLAKIAAEQADPKAMASRALGPILFGPDSPYGIPGTGSGTADSVKSLTRGDVEQFHDAWLRPDKARIFVVSDLPLAQLKSELEARFGQWAGQGQAGVKSFGEVRTAEPRILLIDRKDSPQSLIVGAQLLSVDPKQDILDLEAANDVLGGSFLSRINMDIRETKGWSYGVGAGIGRNEHAVRYQLSAPVQADKTGPAIAALIQDYSDFLGTKGVTAAELERTVNGGVRELPGAFETNNSVLGAIQSNDFYGRPDDYYEKLPARYRALTTASLDQAARRYIDPAKLLWIVVGDADKVKPQLEKLGLPVEQIDVK
jgi:predicted Zn-dependent peptidase